MNLIIMNFSVTARLTRRTSYALPKLAVPYFLYPIHVAAIVIEGYLKQINLYHTHHTGAVTGEAFLFLARKRNGSNTLLCNNKIFYMGSYTKLIYIIFNKQNIFIKFIY